MKLFNLGRNQKAVVQESQLHIHQGDNFNIHLVGDAVQIYRHGYFEQLSRKDAIKYLNGMIYEINQVIAVLKEEK